MNWLIKFFKSPRQIGSIAPSSKSLGKLMTKSLPQNARILELGSGSGSITECILSQISDPTLLTSVEADTELCLICQNKFPDITCYNQDIQEILSQEKSYDFIISGIPFAAMQEKRRHQLFHLIHERLTPGGAFIMFQYSTLTRNELREIFDDLTTDFTPWNLPPAFVFTCIKK
jgi:phospholipid N-methyltransferase